MRLNAKKIYLLTYEIAIPLTTNAINKKYCF